VPRQRISPSALEGIALADIRSLAEFLDREPLCDTSMSASMVDGFLTAIVIGPEPVMPSDYMPWIWDHEEGKVEPGFADAAEAEKINRLLLGMNNRIATGLMKEPPAVVPLYLFAPDWDHEEWLAGFDAGSSFDAEVWRHAAEENPALFEPLEALLRTKRDSDEWMPATLELVKSIGAIRDYFRAGAWRDAFEEVPVPFVRQGPKIGRNDPCPCGSGKKYKKCCADAPPPAS
jgi:uncharacterized protein